MVPTLAVFERAMVLLGADSTTLNKSVGTVNKLMLVKAPFTPGASLTIGDLTEADFDGYTLRSMGTDAAPESLDPLSGASVVRPNPPTTGYGFETTGVTNLPQTIYGYALVNNDASVLYASGLLPDPVTLSIANQSFEVPSAKIALLAGSMV